MSAFDPLQTLAIPAKLSAMSSWKYAGPPSRRWIIGVILAEAVVYGVVFALANADRAFVADISFATIVLAARTRWDLRNHDWFWILIGVFALGHIVAVMLIGWHLHVHPASLLTPFAVADFALMLGLLCGAESVANRLQ